MPKKEFLKIFVCYVYSWSNWFEIWKTQVLGLGLTVKFKLVEDSIRWCMMSSGTVQSPHVMGSRWGWERSCGGASSKMRHMNDVIPLQIEYRVHNFRLHGGNLGQVQNFRQLANYPESAAGTSRTYESKVRLVQEFKKKRGVAPIPWLDNSFTDQKNYTTFGF
jgi:hypothetical protein